MSEKATLNQRSYLIDRLMKHAWVKAHFDVSDSEILWVLLEQLTENTRRRIWTCIFNEAYDQLESELTKLGFQKFNSVPPRRGVEN